MFYTAKLPLYISGGKDTENPKKCVTLYLEIKEYYKKWQYFNYRKVRT